MKTSDQTGFSIIEGLLILVVVGILGFTGWYVYHARQASDKDYSTANNSTVPTYKKKTSTTTAVSSASTQNSACQVAPTKPPTGWKTYTSSQYKFSISYPSTWSVAPSGGEENTPSHTPILTSLDLTPPGNQGSLYDIEVTDQTLAAATSDWQGYIASEAHASTPPAIFTTLDNTSCTFDGYYAQRIDTKQINPASGTVYDTEYYVEANGYAYKFSNNFQNSSTPFSDSTLLGVVESLSIQE